MKKEPKDYFQESRKMAATYLFDYKNKHKITLRQIELQEKKERLIYRIDYFSLDKDWLKPIVAIPVALYCFFFD